MSVSSDLCHKKMLLESDYSFKYSAILILSQMFDGSKVSMCQYGGYAIVYH